MPKVKSKSAAKKRFSKSGGKKGVIKRSHAYRRHLLTKKGAKRRRQLRKSTTVHEIQQKTIALLLPY